MRIGILTHYLALGCEADSGIGQHYLILANTLAAKGHQVHVVYAGHHPVDMARALAELRPTWTYDIASHEPPARLLQTFRSHWPLQDLLKNLWLAWAGGHTLATACTIRSLDIIETHAYNAPALFFQLRTGRPTVVSRVATTMTQISQITAVKSRVFAWQSAIERFATKHCDLPLTHSQQHRRIVCKLEGYKNARFAIVPHGLSPPPAPAVRPASTTDCIEFLFVGRFEARKGIDILLAAIPQVADAFPAARFTLAGSLADGLGWDAFQKSHPELAESRVQALGRVSAETLQTLYACCDVFVAPSRYESFGLIYAEAMSHGKPVIGCDCGGIPEVVTHGLTGLLARPGDIPSLVACMNQLAASASTRRRMGKAALADFSARFSADTMARRSAALYASLSPPIV